MRWASSAGLEELTPHLPGEEEQPGTMGGAHRRAASRTLHRRGASHGGSGIHTATALAAKAAESAEDSNAPGLEFTAETASTMSLEALRELASVLTHIIGTRNRELISLVERHDELEHERDYRQATVAALVAQVDKSKWREEARRKAKR